MDLILMLLRMERTLSEKKNRYPVTFNFSEEAKAQLDNIEKEYKIDLEAIFKEAIGLYIHVYPAVRSGEKLILVDESDQTQREILLGSCNPETMTP